MGRRPPHRRSRLAVIPRWAWLGVAIVLAAAVVLIARHVGSRDDAPIALSDRPLLLRQAQAMLRGDPNVADLVYSGPRDQWAVTPSTPEVDPRAFARYVCFLLGEAAVARPHTSVRVIDGAKLEANGFDYAAASRGTITCEEGER